MKYKDYLSQAMLELSKFDDTIFVGQGIGYKIGGTFISQTLTQVPTNKTLEFVVDEKLQMQFTLGLAIAGQMPISIFVRENFLLLGLADLVNTLDKMKHISEEEFCPKIIIRVAAGPISPIFPGVQHALSKIECIQPLLENTEFIDLKEKNKIVDEYLRCYTRKDGKISLLREMGHLYDS